jgi:ketosteroid isomerase-like protein
MQTSRDWAKACATGDVDLVVSFWAEDAMVLPPDQVAVIGKQEIREFVRQSLAIPGFSLTWEPERATITDGGDHGYLIERNQSTFKDASGIIRTQNGKVITIWRKDFDGQWKCVVDIWNSYPPMP